MVSLNNLTVSFSALLAIANALTIPGLLKRDDFFLKLDFSVQKDTPRNLTFTDVPPLETRDLQARDEVGVPLRNKDYYYIADVYLGSNGQKISVDIDTGSSDLWVIDKASGISGKYGVYDHTASSTYNYLNHDFSIGYFDNSSALGNWVTDTVALSANGASLKDFQFGDATYTYEISYGIFGIGLTSLEAAEVQYPNFPTALKNAGYIKKAAYSLYLDSANAASGSVLFGGIDKSKYTGPLETYPVTSAYRLGVNLPSLTINSNYVFADETVVLDSGSTFSYLDPSLLQRVAEAAGATYDDNGEFYYWNTSCADVPPVTFNFQNGLDITIGSEYVAYELNDDDGNTLTDVCGLAIFPDSRANTLGDNFLRNVYAVYDLDDRTISLGKVSYTGDEDIVPIE